MERDWVQAFHRCASGRNRDSCGARRFGNKVAAAKSMGCSCRRHLHRSAASVAWRSRLLRQRRSVVDLRPSLPPGLNATLLHGLANVNEQLQPLTGAQPGLVAVVRDRQPADQLHNKGGAAHVGRAGIEHQRCGDGPSSPGLAVRPQTGRSPSWRLCLA